MYESPYSLMSKQLLLLYAFFLIAVVLMTISGIVLAVAHLQRRSFDVALVTTLEVIEVAMLLASPLVCLLYGNLQDRVLAGLTDASKLSSMTTQATDIVSRWGYFKNVVNVITSLFVFTGVVVLPYLEVHFRYGSLSEFYQECPSLYESGYLLGPITLSLIAYMVAVIIMYRMIYMYAFIAKVSISGLVIWWFVVSDVSVLLTVSYACLAILSILHSLKKAYKWWSLKQIILFLSLLLTLSTTGVIIWAVLRPHVYHMYLSIMTLLTLALVSILLLFSAMKIVFTKHSSQKWRKVGYLSPLWILVPLIVFLTSREIAEEGVAGVAIMFSPLLVEAFVLLMRAASCLLLQRTGTVLEVISRHLQKLYIVRIGRQLIAFVVDVGRRMRQSFPQGAHSGSHSKSLLSDVVVDGSVC